VRLDKLLGEGAEFSLIFFFQVCDQFRCEPATYTLTVQKLFECS